MVGDKRAFDNWKLVDDSLKALQRLRDILQPLHRSVDINCLISTLECRRASPCYIVGAPLPFPDLSEAPLPISLQAPKLACFALHSGVYVVPLHTISPIEFGAARFCSDVIVGITDETESRTGSYAIAPAIRAASLSSLPPAGSEGDDALRAFGALRAAHHALAELSRIAKMDLSWIDRALPKADDVKGQSVAPEAIDFEYFRRLRSVLDERLQREKDLLRDRDELARMFTLPMMNIAQRLGTEDFDEKERASAVDRYRPSAIRHVYGKTIVDVRLKLDAINRLVDEINRKAVDAAMERTRRIEKALDRIYPGRLQNIFGGALFADTRASLTQLRGDVSVQEHVAGPARNFHFKFERLGALSRFLRARMEIAGLLMVVFLGVSVSGATGDVRKLVVLASLALAFLIALFSYITTPALEEDKREEELLKLRDLVQRISTDAAGRRLSTIMSHAVGELEELRDAINARIEPGDSRKAARPSAIASSKARLSALKTELARELTSTSGVSALQAQIRSGLAADSQLRRLVGPQLSKQIV